MTIVGNSTEPRTGQTGTGWLNSSVSVVSLMYLSSPLQAQTPQGCSWKSESAFVNFTSAVGLRSADRKSTRLNSSHVAISYAVVCLTKKTIESESTCIRDML